MSRASVASSPAPAGERPIIASGSARLLDALDRLRAGIRRYRRLPRDIELVARWSVPAALVGFLAALVAISFSFTMAEQERVVAAATSDVELVASLIADDIDMRVRDNSSAKPSEALAHAIPAYALAHGQRVILSDQSGTIIASYPDTTLGGHVSDHLGAAQPLTVFAEKAGVMRLVLPDGLEALAMVRSLRPPFGQVTVIHPLTDVLGDWRSTIVRVATLIGTVSIVMLALAGAYFYQATKARQADSSCRTMQDRVDMVLSRGRCGLWDWDLIGGRIDWSLSMYEIIGMTPGADGLDYETINALIHPEDGGLDALARALQRGTAAAVDHVFRLRGATGNWVWLRAKAELVRGKNGSPHLVGIAIDITETMALEERTARADMRLRDAIETISEAFVVWDAENRLVMCNSKFQRFHDLPNDAVRTGTPYAEVMERGTEPLIQSQVTLGEPQPMGARSFEAQLGDGRWLQVNERRTKDGGYVSVGTDITALKRNEEQLIESERRLMSTVVDLRKSRQELETNAQQLADLAERYLEQKAEAENANRAKSDFLANMGHELRTPLNAILGFSEIMMMESYGELGSPLYQEYCRDIHTSGQYLLNVIADVLEMSRLEAGRIRLEKEDFLVSGAVEAAVASVADAATTNAIAITREATGNAKLFADRCAVEKILGILLANAVKYTPAGGKVMVRARAVQGAVNIYVEDTGVGIPPEALARLGKPFEQSDQGLKNGMRGSGLGLAIARSLVELHGGSLRIRSQPDAGTVVLVHLPNRQAKPRPNLKLATSSGAPVMPRAGAQSVGIKASKLSRTA